MSNFKNKTNTKNYKNLNNNNNANNVNNGKYLNNAIKHKIIDTLDNLNTKLSINDTYNQLIYDYISTDIKEIEQVINANGGNLNDKYLMYYYQMQHNKQAILNLLTEILNNDNRDKLDEIINLLMR